MNIFERASRANLRFASAKGELSTEQLWQLPLNSLDQLAQTAHREATEAQGISFVTPRSEKTRAQVMAELKLDILKHIIADKLAQADANRNAAQKAQERARLLEVLAAKKEAQLSNLSEEDILKKLEELDN